MKLKVLKKFADKYDRSIKYEVGDILHTEETERANDLVNRGLAEVVKDEEDPDNDDETGTKEGIPPADDPGSNPGEEKDAGSTVENPAAGQNNGDPETQNEQQDADVQNGTEDPSGDAPSDTDETPSDTDEAPSDAEKATKKSPKKKED